MPSTSFTPTTAGTSSGRGGCWRRRWGGEDEALLRTCRHHDLSRGLPRDSAAAGLCVNLRGSSVWHKPLTLGFWGTPLIPHWEPIVFWNLHKSTVNSVMPDVMRANPERDPE